MRETAVSIERDHKLRQIEKLTASPVLQGSESLCHLLRYLGQQALDHPGIPIKEYQIATEVFGRPGDFDPRLDSTVRVQTGRLRSKLAEYYVDAGAQDDIVVELPKGHYELLFHPRALKETASASVVASVAPRVRGWVLPAVGIVAVVALVLWVAPHAVPGGSAGAPAPLRTFWKGFIDTVDAPLVVYSNAEFVGRPETGMRYFDPAVDPPAKALMDHYTGVGEVLAIHELDRVFFAFRHPLRVRRGRLLSWDDAKNSDVIFIGSPSENLSLRELRGTQRFVFQRDTTTARRGDLTLVNTQPAPGEPAVYYATTGLPITEDYGLVGLVPGLNPARWVLVLAGITTFGTQAAVEFVCRPASLQPLLARLGAPENGPVPSFEAIIRVKVSGGVPVQTELVALHKGQ
ncbi:MAG: helix-turn-helix domain-containing protein [Acidobacteria bacterium]|nr:helix-turn-helix domain-containing protein [Acidobacteriota bacterium]MBI3471017.1 helix-turn-helix domain-containing protein [Candidatus Solibacter usitatus]